jgi:hypothetical protein
MSSNESPSKPVALNAIIKKFFPTAEALDHFVRFMSSWSGSDKLFMLLQHTARLIIPFLNLRARLQFQAGKRPLGPSSNAALGLASLATKIGDARTLGRLFGSVPIVQWLLALEKHPHQSESLQNIERFQAWSMLFYYGFEHLSYLSSHGIISLPKNPRISAFSSSGKLSLWSCRFWALYVVLQLLHLRFDVQALKERAIRLMKTTNGPTTQEKQEMKAQKETIRNEMLVNLAWLPVSVHWSLEGGLFGNELWADVLGMIAGVLSTKAVWRATALV